MLIRSYLFYFLLALWTIIMGFFCLPFLILPNKFLRKPINLWIKGLLKLLEISCNITYELKGLENIPNRPVIIASKHQSAFETFIFFLYIKNSIFIHKKQLFLIPIFGQYLQKTKMISIDRSRGTRAMREVLTQSKQKVLDGNSIVIFPEGTRKNPGDAPEYKTGVAGIYEIAETEVVPVALNSGKYWPKTSFIKSPGNIIMKFLKPIPPNLEKKEFLNKIQSMIEGETKKII